MQASRDCGGKPWYLVAYQPLQSFLIKTLYLGTETDFYFTYKHHIPGHPLLYRADQRCNWEVNMPCRAAGITGTQCSQVLSVYPAPAANPLRQLQLRYSFLYHQRTHSCWLFLLSQQKHLKGSRFSIHRNNMGAVSNENTHITDKINISSTVLADLTYTAGH